MPVGLNGSRTDDAARMRDRSTPGGANRARPVRLVGCGRSQRRDDQVGLLVAAALADPPLPGTVVTASQAPGADLVADLENVELLVIVDAAAATDDFPVGTWRRIAYDTLDRSVSAPGARVASISAHSLGVWDALELGRELGILPADVWVDVVAGSDFGYGAELSPRVQAALPGVIERLRADVCAWLTMRPSIRR
jgi:hydrogenase maturation protease